MDTRLDPCEEMPGAELSRLLVKLTAVFEDTDAVDGENVNGDVDPFVVTQPYVGKKLVVSHVLCTVTVTTSIMSAPVRARANAATPQTHLARECSKVWCTQWPTRRPRELATSCSSTG
jgi:hypothetical protein